MADKQPWGPRYLSGTDVPRLDAADKVTGRAKYTYDIKLPGMLYGKLLRSPHACATVVKVDLSRAAAHPGVKAVLDFEKKAVWYAGEEVAAVAAVSPEAAEEAIGLIDVAYEPKPFLVTEEQAMAADAPKIHPSGNVQTPQPRTRGDVDAGFAQAAKAIEATYRTQVHTHCCMETHGAVARWEGNSLTVWVSTQGVVGSRDDLAKFFQIPQTQVRAITQHMGGGFGSKFGVGLEGIAAARLAKAAGAPVKLMLSRKEEQLCTGNRPSMVAKIRMGAKV